MNKWKRFKLGLNGAHQTGGRGYFPRPWADLSPRSCRAPEPAATQGDVCDWELPNRSPLGGHVAGRVFPCGLHATIPDRRYCLPEQGGGLRSAVQGIIPDAVDHCSRSQTPRCEDRHDIGPAHIGTGDDAPSACPRRCSRRRLVTGRSALDRLPPRVLTASEGPVAVVPASLC